MSEKNILELIRVSEGPLLGDGAMGTILNSRGVSFENCFDELNLTNPSAVAGVHREYIEAGSQIIQTNTFGANRFKLSGHGLEDKLEEINQLGVELARKVVEASFKDVLIAGDIGPLGVRLAPFGRVSQKQARDAFKEQAIVLVITGVDLLILETFSDLIEIREAVLAVREMTDLPVIASVTFTRDDRTLLGDSPAKVARTLRTAGADIIGANCSGGPAQIFRILKEMKREVPEGIFSVMPNAGWPEQIGGRIMYPANQDYFGEYTVALCQAGASVIGGCCGTTPSHIATMHNALQDIEGGCDMAALTIQVVDDLAPAETIDNISALAQSLAEGTFVVAVEMDPPRGLSPHKLLAGASLLADVGADSINVADSPMARMRMSPWAVCELIQDKVGVETTLHFPTRGRNLLRVQGDLLAAHALGIRNIFVVMGDPTSIGDYPEAMDNFDLAPSGLIKLIKQGFNLGLDHSGTDIGQPTSFFVGTALNLTSSDSQREMKVLNRKIRAGADFILTQPIYEPEKAFQFVNEFESRYGKINAPILVGILPLYSARHSAFLHNEVPGINIPTAIQKRMEVAGDNAPQEGLSISIDLINRMKPWASGIYLIPAFHRYDLSAEIVESVRA